MDPQKQKQHRRLRRKRRIRKSLFGSPERPRLTITRSLKNLHCQAIDDFRGVTLASASSQSPEIRDEVASHGGSCKGAALVGTLFAKRAKEAGISRVSFDRNGYRFHGRVKALAEAVRKEGIEV